MRASSMAWVRGVASVLALMTALTFAAPPCSAAAAGPGSTKASGKRTLAAAAAARVAAQAPPSRALAQDPSGSATGGSRSFFRTPTGIAAIVLMVAGGGYALYSVSHDQKPVKSPIR